MPGLGNLTKDSRNVLVPPAPTSTYIPVLMARTFRGLPLLHTVGDGSSAGSAMTTSRRSRGYARKRTQPPFKAWGLLLTAALVILSSRGLWTSSFLVAGILVFYLLAVKITPCRVETTRHLPCKWRVRGIFSTCEFHTGYKRGLPRTMPGRHPYSLPMLIWHRSDLSPYERLERQPAPHARGEAAMASGVAQSATNEMVMKWVAIAGLTVAMATFLRDLIAG